MRGLREEVKFKSVINLAKIPDTCTTSPFIILKDEFRKLTRGDKIKILTVDSRLRLKTLIIWAKKQGYEVLETGEERGYKYAIIRI